MRKIIGILALVMILCLAIVMPGLAVKIAPYSQPLHDIIHWDAKSAKLIIQNPEGESLIVAWPATVDFWNYEGATWTFDLPTGDTFNFAKQLKGTITNPLIEQAGVFGQVNSGDAVGWTTGEVTGVRGELNVATLSPGTYGTGAGGWFELEYDAVETADGVGMTCALYAKVTNEIAARAPSACLWLEDVTTGDGDARLMPMIVMTSSGTAGDKSQYAFSFGFAAAGTTVSTEDGGNDSMFRTGGNAATNIVLKQGIQVIVNGSAYYIPLILTTDWSDD